MDKLQDHFSEEAQAQARFIEGGVKKMTREMVELGEDPMSVMFGILGAALTDAYESGYSNEEAIFHAATGLLHTIHAQAIARRDRKKK